MSSHPYSVFCHLLSPKANVLINNNGHACLADFGLVTIVSDPAFSTTSAPSTGAGTIRWMSPELLDPERFGFKHSRPTKESDCYALGMVIYEVLSGQAPFYAYRDFLVLGKVVEGKRPERPLGAERVWFEDDLWAMLEQCWSEKPKERPTPGTVLEYLVSKPWQPLPSSVDEAQQDNSSLVSIESHYCRF
jgi:serine/threonine protein kinase